MFRTGTALHVRGHKWGLLALMLSALLSGGALLAPAIQAHPQRPQYVECSTTRENDNNTVTWPDNPVTDWTHAMPSLGNTWQVYYDTLRDSHDNALCQMRVVLRIFPPSGGGVYTPVVVYPAQQCGTNYCIVTAGVYSTQAYASYPGHFVGRGPWFYMDSGVNFSIESWDNTYKVYEDFMDFTT